MQQRHENRKTYFQELATTSELHFLPYIHRFMSLPKAGFLKSVVAKVAIWYPLPASAAGLQALIYPKTASGKPASSSRKKDCPPLS